MCTLLLICGVFANITIQGPESLKELFKNSNYTIPVAYGNYGRIPYGQSMIGRLQYNNTYSEGCNRTDAIVSKFEESGPMEAPVMMVERGDCSFVTKTRNIARAGGKLAIVIDTYKENITDVTMSDDGTGMGISIPSVLIGRKDGETLKHFMGSANVSEIRQIVLNIEFKFPSQRSWSEVEYWYSQENEQSMRFLRYMGEFIKPIFGDKVSGVNFLPKFVTWACPLCDSTFKKEHCLSNGKYCAQHQMALLMGYEYDQAQKKLSGREILLENLRQHCIMDTLPEKNGGKSEFFKYLEDVDELCKNRITRKCFEQAIKDIRGTTQQKVEECVDKTFDGTLDHGDNWLYNQMATQWQNYGTMITPTLIINNEVFRGQKNPDNAFEAICSSFFEQYRPDVCTRLLVEDGIISASKGGVSTVTLIIIISVVIAMNLVIALVYRNYLQKEIKQDMKIQVSSAVSQYVALSQIKDLGEEGATTDLSAIQK